jgi:hypothetical protein
MATPKTPAALAKRLQSAKGAALAGNFTSLSISSSSLLDVFPVWNEQQAAEKEDRNAGQTLLICSYDLYACLCRNSFSRYCSRHCLPSILCWDPGMWLQESTRTAWVCPFHQQLNHSVMHGSGQRSCCRGFQQCPWSASGLLLLGTHQHQQTGRKVGARPGGTEIRIPSCSSFLMPAEYIGHNHAAAGLAGWDSSSNSLMNNHCRTGNPCATDDLSSRAACH